jgi:hypothetical protein
MIPFPAVGTRALVVLGMMAVVGCAASREETNRTSFVPREPAQTVSPPPRRIINPPPVAITGLLQASNDSTHKPPLSGRSKTTIRRFVASRYS